MKWGCSLESLSSSDLGERGEGRGEGRRREIKGQAGARLHNHRFHRYSL